MMTCRVHGSASVQTAFWGMVTWNVREPVGTLSAITGCVGDQTGFVRGTVVEHAAVVAVAGVGSGSGMVVIVCVALAPFTSATRYHPVCGTVTVTVTETVAPGSIPPLTMWVGSNTVVGGSPLPRVAAHGPAFCG
jgi:hypothetical protein